MKPTIGVSFTLAIIVLFLYGCSNASTRSEVTPTVNIPANQTNTAQAVITTLTDEAPAISRMTTSPQPVISATLQPLPPTPAPSSPTPPDQSSALGSTPTFPVDAPTPPYSPETEVYAVYSALIQTRYIDPRNPELIVISDQTSLDYFSGELSEHLESVRQGLPDLTDEVCVDFEAQNRQPQALKSLLTLSVKYVFVSPQEIQTTFERPDGWDTFYAKYPNSQGFIHLSGVGFNSQGDVALVYVDNMSYALAGEGYYVLLRKIDGQWLVQDLTAVWGA